jgi:hypothetical protein
MNHSLAQFLCSGAVEHHPELLTSPDHGTQDRLDALLVELSRHSFSFPVPVRSLTITIAAHEPNSHGQLSGYLYSGQTEPVGVFALVHGGALPASNLAVGPIHGRNPIRAVRAKALSGGAIDRNLLKRGSPLPLSKVEFQAAVSVFQGAFPDSFQIAKAEQVPALSSSHCRMFPNSDRALLTHIWDSLCDSLDVALAAASTTQIAVFTGIQL